MRLSDSLTSFIRRKKEDGSTKINIGEDYDDEGIEETSKDGKDPNHDIGTLIL